MTQPTDPHVGMSLIQLSKLLSLPEEELKQVLEYSSTLSKSEAVEHFTNLLGDSPQVIEFISAFNAKRADSKSKKDPSASATTILVSHAFNANPSSDGVPKSISGAKKKKKGQNLHTPPPRLVTALASPGKAYSKKDTQDDYMTSVPGKVSTSTPLGTNTPSCPLIAPPLKAQPSWAVTLAKKKTKSKPVSRTSTPGPSVQKTTKVSIAGGTPKQGASTTLAELDDAIRSLELSTNPSHASNSAEGTAARRCNCVATLHPLQAAAPNCLSCGKVVCIKEGLGPCTFCGTPLLTSAEVQSMIRELRHEAGQEKMAANREANRRADVATKPRPFTKPRGGEDLSLAETKAREHRDKLLGFQAQNVKRTTVRDEAADLDTWHYVSLWATPEERARQLREQKKRLREIEWNERPEYEKRRQVVSIDLVGRKVVREMAPVERSPSPTEESDISRAVNQDDQTSREGGGVGAFSKNPLSGITIKPVYDAKGRESELEGRTGPQWRRVQDNLSDDEGIILDDRNKGAESDEPPCG